MTYTAPMNSLGRAVGRTLRLTAQCDERRGKVAKRYLEGATVRELVAEFEVSRVTIQKYLRQSREEWRKVWVERAVEIVDRELALLDRMEDECWDQYEKSKEGVKKVKTVKGPAGDVISVEVSVSGEGRAHEAWMARLDAIHVRRREILGLTPKPEQLTSEHTAVPLTPEEMTRQILEGVNRLKPVTATVVGEPPAYSDVTEEKEISEPLSEPETNPEPPGNPGQPG